MPDASTSFRFSTDDLLEAAHAKVVRELHEHATLPNKGRPEPLEPLQDYRVRLNVTQRVLPGVVIMSGTLCGVRHAIRSRGSVSSSEDDLLVAVNLSGRTIVHPRDRELVLLDGDAMLMTRELDQPQPHPSDAGKLPGFSGTARRYCATRRQHRRRFGAHGSGRLGRD